MVCGCNKISNDNRRQSKARTQIFLDRLGRMDGSDLTWGARSTAGKRPPVARAMRSLRAEVVAWAQQEPLGS